MTIGQQNKINAQQSEISALLSYQKWAPSTAIYPPLPSGVLKVAYRQNPLYVAMKLQGEIGEFREAGLRSKLAELGDCFWYCAMLCNEYGWNMATLCEDGRTEVQRHFFLRMIKRTLLFEQPDEYLFTFSSRLSEAQGKLMRDGDSEALMERSRLALAAVIYLLKMCCHALGQSVERVLEMSREKLKDRANRGVLQGSGDER